MMSSTTTPASTINIPSGGGAMRGLGEKFSPDLHTGTCNIVLPIELPPGRAGLTPDLRILYSSGNGNGPFGLGWQLSTSLITRLTSKGIPRYTEEDTFVLSGTEELREVGEYAA